jgi:gas vesicle protein
MNSGNILFGVLVSAAAGALLGVLFAPEKVTIKKISKKGSDPVDDQTEKFKELPKSFNEKIEMQKSKQMKLRKMLRM